MKLGDKILLATLVVVFVLSVSLTAYRTFVMQDFLIIESEEALDE